jgi:hypothetical protein
MVRLLVRPVDFPALRDEKHMARPPIAREYILIARGMARLIDEARKAVPEKFR